jgi:TonB-linked SusC/RagA family outer membrane protein
MKKITILIVLGLLCLNFRLYAHYTDPQKGSYATGDPPLKKQLSFNQSKPALTPSNLNLPNPPLAGRVTDSLGNPLTGATIRVRNGAVIAMTDRNGTFQIKEIKTGTNLEFSFIGYQTLNIQYTGQGDLNIVLTLASSALEEVHVVYTGYQALPKERATGSFVQIDNALLNRNTSSNILDRLTGVVSGLLPNGMASTTISTGPQIRTLGIDIRGTSTLSSNVNTDPLIVVDNFPYEGNISNLNPNDIESVTVLKDAAAASIWGARSGNGVIVITTKKGRKNQAMSVDLVANVTVQNKPNLSYDRNVLQTNDYIDIESLLFAKGYYDSYLSDTYTQPAVSPVVGILARQRSGALSTADATAQINGLRNYDVRQDFQKYLYRKAIKQQYSASMRGGTAQNSYTFSIGYDQNQDNLIRNNFDRLTLNALNVYSPTKKLDITTGINYSQNTTFLNNQLNWGYGLNVGGSVSGIYPYAQLADANSNHLIVPKDYNPAYLNNAGTKGLTDWSYRPLDEVAFADNSTKVSDLLLKVSTRYKFTSYLNAEAQYQNERQVVNSRNYQTAQTYYVRNLINRFTVIDPATGTAKYQFPQGGVLNQGNSDYSTHNARLQLNFEKTLADEHTITAIAGVEVRKLSSTGYQRDVYGYNDQFGTAIGNLNYADFLPTNPSGSDRLPIPAGNVSGTENRYLSYFANAGYTYRDRYTLTLSGRKDGSNIFGVKANNRVTPLWSSGLGWTISSEKFYHVAWMPYLKARLSYGYNGNVYNGSALVTGTYTSSSLTGLPMISGLTAPNPYLSWEKVRNINAGLDFSVLGDRIAGTVELYQKDGVDLIDNVPLFPSSGFSSYFGNAASTTTKGIDLTLNSKNIKGRFIWSTALLFSTLKDKVTKYNATYNNTWARGMGGSAVVGKSLFGLYSYRSAGLDPANGDPQGYINGKVSKDYTGIINNYQPDSLVYSGSVRPTIYGSIRNDFDLHGFSLSVNVIYKLGYKFRRSSTSTNYASAIGANQNTDFADRWQKPGDELSTTVPSVVYPTNTNRDAVYQYSESLIEKGDHIRLQDLRLSYTLNKSKWRALPFKSLQVYSYASNLGILWRANKRGIDPDLGSVQSHLYPSPFTLALGINAHL